MNWCLFLEQGDGGLPPTKGGAAYGALRGGEDAMTLLQGERRKTTDGRNDGHPSEGETL